MTGRVLVVDDVEANVKLLEVRLSAEYFDVITARRGDEALAICERGRCDIVLLDVMMPGMDGFEVCRRLKAGETTQHIPGVMITSLDQPSDRLTGLQAGADDFLAKPVSEVALIARVRSLTRLKLMTDELRMRSLTSRHAGMQNAERAAVLEAGRNGRILLVEDRKPAYQHIAAALAGEHSVDVEPDPNVALFRAAEGNYELVIASLGLTNFDALRLCSQIRLLERTRNLPILVIADGEDNARLARGLEVGVSDYLFRPAAANGGRAIRHSPRLGQRGHHHIGRDCGSCCVRQPGKPAQACRSGALPRQACRPQPRSSGRCVIARHSASPQALRRRARHRYVGQSTLTL